MQTVSFERAHEILDDAVYVQPPLDGGDKTIHFGIDQRGHKFVLIVSAIDGKGRLGLL